MLTGAPPASPSRYRSTARAVAAGQHDRAGAEREHGAYELPRLGRLGRLGIGMGRLGGGSRRRLRRSRELRRLAPQQRPRLGQVRRQHRGARDELAHERPLGVGLEQPGAGLGDHHRVEHDRRAGRELVERRRDRERDLGVAEHPDLHGVHADVGEHRADLGQHHLRGDRVDRAHAERVLGGQRRDRAGAVHAAARERLEVGLDAGAAPGVRAGDREDGRGQLAAPVVVGAPAAWRLRAGKIA
jgi:hypothetical protein